MAKKSRIISSLHPDYLAMRTDWIKFRQTYDGGKVFVETYLKKFSIREDAVDFATRRDISYCPAHAKAAIIDIKNAIYQRLVEIQRINGPSTYQMAVAGQNGGVNRHGMTMTTFMGTQILPELIVLAKVGVFIDKDNILGKTKLSTRNVSPYLYYYPAEDILSWSYFENTLKSVLLRDYVEVEDPSTGLVTGKETKYRLLQLTENGVDQSIYNADGKSEGQKESIDLPRIPFVVGNISQSLLVDVADYQIALLNMESSDIGYSLKSNFPFYVEQFNPQFDNFKKLQVADDTETGEPTRANLTAAGQDDLKIGASHGRRYGKGLERPAFINPSSEPLEASMKKESQIKEDIRKLVNLSLKNLERPSGSQSSDLTDEKGLEAGLSYIGMELERIEREVSVIWALYENDKPAEVKYPKNYSLKTDQERRDEIKSLRDLKESIPSKTFQKEIDIQIADLTLGNKVTFETLEKIKKEIKVAIVTVTDHETIREDHKEGLVSDVTASIALGYPVGEAEQAKKDHAERAARIVEAQASVKNRGVSDLQNTGDDDVDKLDKNRRGVSNDDN